MKFFEGILFFFFAYLIFRSVLKYLGLGKRQEVRSENTYQRPYSQNQSSYKSTEVGKTTITHIPEKEEEGNSKGEYVDFEKID